MLEADVEKLVLDSTLNPGLRADILRLYILKNYRQNGANQDEMVVNIYSDIDMACLKSMDEFVIKML